MVDYRSLCYLYTDQVKFKQVEWQQFLAEHKNDVIIRVRKDELVTEPSGRTRFIHLNADGAVQDKSSLLQEFYVKGEFGEYFGFNWDALIECLTDQVQPGISYVVYIFHHYRGFEQASKQEFDYFLDTFALAAYSSKYELKQYELILLLVDDL